MRVCKKCDLEKPLEAFPPSTRCKEGRAWGCYECRAKRRRANGEADRTVARTRANRQALRAVYKEWKLSRGCHLCGYRRCADALDAHHVGEKNFEIAHKLSQNISVEKLERELALCVVVCANCHREIHAGVSSLE